MIDRDDLFSAFRIALDGALAFASSSGGFLVKRSLSLRERELPIWRLTPGAPCFVSGCSVSKISLRRALSPKAAIPACAI
jgi:hypothetical protein